MSDWAYFVETLRGALREHVAPLSVDAITEAVSNSVRARGVVFLDRDSAAGRIGGYAGELQLMFSRYSSDQREASERLERVLLAIDRHLSDLAPTPTSQEHATPSTTLAEPLQGAEAPPTHGFKAEGGEK